MTSPHRSSAAPDWIPARRPPVAVGQSWSLDVGGVPAASLAGERGLAALKGLFAALVDELGLHPVDEPVWHVFPGPHAGVTGIIALSESHLSCHSFPEHEGLTLDLYTCRPRRAPDWAALIARHLGGSPEVVLREVSRSIPGRHGAEEAR